MQIYIVALFFLLSDFWGVLYPVCQSKTKVVHQYTTHKIRDLNISGREVYLMVKVRQFECSCGRYFNESLDFVEPNKSYTKRQAKWVFELSAKQPLSEVGALTNMNTKTVERIFYDSASRMSVDRYASVEKLGIDEISFRKGKKDYLCVLTDLDTGQTIDILRTRKKEDLIAHFTSISNENGQLFTDQVKVICCDFWGPFIDIANKYFPNATLVGDRFHSTTYLNKVLDNTRKDLRKEFPEEEIFKNIKWLLFKNQNTLNKEDKLKLKSAFDLSPQLHELYEMAKTFTGIFDCSFSYDFGVQQVKQWINYAEMINQKHLTDFINFLQRNLNPILNYFKHPVSNAATEGNNNVLRTVKRFTFNMTNFEHFKARCFAFKY